MHRQPPSAACCYSFERTEPAAGAVRLGRLRCSTRAPTHSRSGPSPQDTKPLEERTKPAGSPPPAQAGQRLGPPPWSPALVPRLGPPPSPALVPRLDPLPWSPTTNTGLKPTAARPCAARVDGTRGLAGAQSTSLVPGDCAKDSTRQSDSTLGAGRSEDSSLLLYEADSSLLLYEADSTLGARSNLRYLH
jgi:hypothetical protein